MSDDENLVEKPSSTTASDKMEPTEAGTTEVKGAVKSEDVTASDSVDESVKHDAVADPAAISPEPTTASKPGKTTPKKRGSASKDEATTPKKKRTPVKVRAEDDDADDDGKETVTPRKRRAPGAPVTPGRPIPANFDAADEADRMLFKMKEDGCGWLEIRTAWTKATGENPGASTLPNRYNRLKANFVEFTEADEERLVAAKADVEAKFALEKWNKIAESMEAAGSQKYSSLFIQKKLKELEKKGDTGKAGIAVSGHGTAEED